MPTSSTLIRAPPAERHSNDAHTPLAQDGEISCTRTFRVDVPTSELNATPDTSATAVATPGMSRGAHALVQSQLPLPLPPPLPLPLPPGCPDALMHWCSPSYRYHYPRDVQMRSCTGAVPATATTTTTATTAAATATTTTTATSMTRTKRATPNDTRRGRTHSSTSQLPDIATPTPPCSDIPYSPLKSTPPHSLHPRQYPLRAQGTSPTYRLTRCQHAGY